MFSRRTSWDLAANALAGALEEARASGRPLLDLTESNPTKVGLTWPAEVLAEALGDRRVPVYEPAPRGLPEARAAVAGYLAAHGAAIDPDRIVLTASTSEGYALLLKLLCDPEDEVLVPAPAYPLLDLLAGLEAVRLVRYPLRHHGGDWSVDLEALAASVTPRTRAVVVISPSNPTGWTLSEEERAALERLCAARGLALIGDEVFADSALAPARGVLAARGCLAFHLSGLSKVCGLPQLKAGWIAVAGPERQVATALERLEVIADAYLSVSGPAQLALPGLLARREAFLAPLRARLSANRAAAGAVRDAPLHALRSGGGWSAVLRIGETLDEEAVCLDLLADGVVVQPGFFYDFERSGHLVVSLLPEPSVFREGLARVEARLRR